MALDWWPVYIAIKTPTEVSDDKLPTTKPLLVDQSEEFPWGVFEKQEEPLKSGSGRMGLMISFQNAAN